MKAYTIIAPHQTYEHPASRPGEARDVALQLNHAADGISIDEHVQFFVKGKQVCYEGFLTATLQAYEAQGAKFRETHHQVWVRHGASNASNTWHPVWVRN